MPPETVTTRTATIWLRDDGIVQIVIFPNAAEGQADAQTNVATCFRVGGERRRPVLVDVRQMKGFEREARVYYSSEETAQIITALGLLVGSPLSRVLANFFLGLNRVRVPTKLFISEEKAVEWLKGFSE